MEHAGTCTGAVSLFLGWIGGLVGNLFVGRPPSDLTMGLRRSMGEYLSDDDRWMVEAVETRQLDCLSIVNGMSDRLKRRHHRCVVVTVGIMILNLGGE